MKVKVIKRFRDKHTKQVYNIDSVYEGSQSRIKELQKLKFVGEEIKEQPSLLDGNVQQTKNAITSELGPYELNQLLHEEKQDKKRKGVIEHIESLLESE
ncbi:hypothetical protein ACFSKI_19165 [Pseudogracilibacillus auburnensis]|uniref:Uncharacterized protein n=1 Tax=Pseudogracilibacillus auburnensis TaxID=1494959 RepID=A0A2V3W6Q2_9BACI|nr:hypothetical protein [Pseudogracilibacillus auburnensis]MBO1003741.1 hypothetical protein [Pseudogracilibacillus auburnensis]PXW88818.1 hypothetical protein DFR56_103324 [Pseudogracilibacillus auburnensis]